VTHWTPRPAASPTPYRRCTRVRFAGTRVTAFALTAFALTAPTLLPAQDASARTSFVVASGGEATVPVPTLMEGPNSSVENSDVADQLFARLAQLGPTLITSGDRAFEPLLARSWTRRDSVTLAFDLDPRATWHDGVPVTATDVVFTFGRARNPAVSLGLAALLRRIASVTAEGDHRVVFHYTEPYAEQLYDAVFHVAPLPAHLLASIPAGSLEKASFVQAPVGSGPYRWVRRVPGELIELAANDRFFLGAPAVRRLIFRTAANADARLNMLLAGEADATENIPPPRANIDRVRADKDLRIIPVPSPTLGFLLFNQRDPRDRNRPHPILGDRDVRRAIGLALDRRLIVKAVLGSAGEVPYGPASSILWIRHGAPAPAAMNLREARRLLDGRGWTDHDGDGVRDRAGQPLALSLIVPTTSAIRLDMAQIVQEQLRALGVRLEISQTDRTVYTERRTAGAFDIDFASTSQDPSPSGLTQGWSCQGRTNFARYCDPVVDSLIDAAILTTEGAGPAWHGVLRRIEDDSPAVFMYVLSYMYAVNRRFTNVRIRPESAWLGLREWTVGPQGARRPAGY
jgi:peptide/nickel transport system substrate-binding protein